MADQYCTSCGSKLMSTMRICPSCGGKLFSPSPVVISQAKVPPTHVHARPSSPASGPHQVSAKIILFEPAGHWRRLGASLIDALAVSIIAGIPIALGYLFSISKSDEISPNIITVVLILASIVIPYIYYTVLHSSEKRATFGKSAMGLVLITVQGERLTKLQAFLRIIITALLPIGGLLILGLSAAGIAIQYKEELRPSLVMAIALGALVVYIGPFLLVFLNSRHQTLFDLICKTCVIKNPNS